MPEDEAGWIVIASVVVVIVIAAMLLAWLVPLPGPLSPLSPFWRS
jgi:hypothetical protein